MKTMLVVEDNPDDAELLRIALEDNDIASGIELVTDGESALARLGDDDRPLPALVLLDLKVPPFGGLEILRRLRSDAATRHLPVVVLTSSHDDHDRLESYRLGANSYVRKPAGFAAFTSTVRQIGRYWMLLNEVA